ncbi:hypothetical protein MANES_15G085450v8 [Manihot esculenta]|uniref:Uncharacterized protein n=1 Tax=Manihot esculenta TaxID=3983 RepID=A0ACB7GEH0_MANES|nr:hypothetical protein MANES_15G085450v8 [Manihot esculenta]
MQPSRKQNCNFFKVSLSLSLCLCSEEESVHGIDANQIITFPSGSPSTGYLIEIFCIISNLHASSIAARPY